ncbi:MAG: cytochrome b N-terminal domain-containing protein [Chloroflexi bacterium]|nr:cytochrome b N-terminal domain-containing protein [Chloroflexota bacterium]
MNLTGRLRERLVAALPPEELLPDEQPAYVHSYVYLFGILTFVSLVLCIMSGIILAAFGPQWWHVSAVGHFFNSIHFWSVQTFFFCLALHIWAQFFMGAWRDGRETTWVTGAITFAVAIGTAFTGYLSQQNFDSQWIAVQGKDAMNAMGIGAFFNLLNFGQMYGFHIVILPLVVALLVGVHLALVRHHGVVKPYPLPEEEQAS